MIHAERSGRGRGRKRRQRETEIEGERERGGTDLARSEPMKSGSDMPSGRSSMFTVISVPSSPGPSSRSLLLWTTRAPRHLLLAVSLGEGGGALGFDQRQA